MALNDETDTISIKLDFKHSFNTDYCYAGNCYNNKVISNMGHYN